MRILIFNWSDIKNPSSGGAEVLTHELAKRWVRAGHQVTQFCSQYPYGKPTETIDGVAIIRQGSAIVRARHIPVHLKAFLWYQRYGKGNYDVVVDEIHGIPFFTPFYVKEKKIAFICEVANGIWDAAFPFPLNVIGKTIETWYFRWYQNIPFLTISESTKDDLTRKGIDNGHITVLPMGLTVPKRQKNFPKEKRPTLLFVGRIAKTKGVENTIETLRYVRQTVPLCTLWVVGQGDRAYELMLRAKIKKLHLEQAVRFFGFVPESKKFELMERAHVLLVPSLKEGWGLIVPEAGYVRTPTVAFNVSGLRDVIQNGTSGILTEMSPSTMAQAVTTLFGNASLYKKLQDGARKRAKTFHWDATARVALSILEQNV